MVKSLIYVVLGASIAAAPAHAMNAHMYKCGDVDVKLALVKDEGRVVGTNVYFRIKLRGNYPIMRGGLTRVAPIVIFRGVDDVKEFSVAGVKYECKWVADGFSDSED